jgi:hypothetical protein
VVAARLVEERRARPLFEGQRAIFEALDGGSGLVVLRSRGAAKATEVVTAIAPGGWLVVGSAPRALAELSPYATRTLAARAATPGESVGVDLPPAALDRVLAAAVVRGWSGVKNQLLHEDDAQRAAHGGRAPDFGDPRAIVGTLDAWVQDRIAVLRDLDRAHLAIQVEDDAVRATLTTAPRTPGGPARALVEGLHTGDVSALGRLPRETVLGLVTRDDAATRAKDAAGIEVGIATTLGSRLGAGERKAVHAALDDWAQARGDWITLALTMAATDREFVLDVASSDPARSARGVREAVELAAHVPAFRDPLEGWAGSHALTIGPAGPPASAAVTTARFATGSPFMLAWAPGQTDLRLALGEAPFPLLQEPRAGAALGDDPAIRALLASLGDVSTAIVAQPGRAPGCTAAGGMVLAWGSRKDPGGQVSLVAEVGSSDSSLRCLLRAAF